MHPCRPRCAAAGLAARAIPVQASPTPSAVTEGATTRFIDRLLHQSVVSDTVVTVHCWAVSWAGMPSLREAMQALLGREARSRHRRQPQFDRRACALVAAWPSGRSGRRIDGLTLLVSSSSNSRVPVHASAIRGKPYLIKSIKRIGFAAWCPTTRLTTFVGASANAPISSMALRPTDAWTWSTFIAGLRCRPWRRRTSGHCCVLKTPP